MQNEIGGDLGFGLPSRPERNNITYDEFGLPDDFPLDPLSSSPEEEKKMDTDDVSGSLNRR